MPMPPGPRSSAPLLRRGSLAALSTALWLSLAAAPVGCTGAPPGPKTGEKEAAPKQPPPSPQTPGTQPYAPPPPDVKLPPPEPRPQPEPQPEPKVPEPRPHLPPPT